MPAETQISKWGNSLAVRIPRSIVRGARLSSGDHVEVDLTAEGSIILRPARRKYNLDELVARITARNRHRETDWGPAKGKESW
jgi:antitoxin MazE